MCDCSHHVIQHDGVNGACQQCNCELFGFGEAAEFRDWFEEDNEEEE